MEVDTLASSMKWAMQPALVLDRVPRNVYLKGRRTSTGCSHSTENDYRYVGKGHRCLTDYLVVTTALVTPCVSDPALGDMGSVTVTVVSSCSMVSSSHWSRAGELELLFRSQGPRIVCTLPRSGTKGSTGLSKFLRVFSFTRGVDR